MVLSLISLFLFLLSQYTLLGLFRYNITEIRPLYLDFSVDRDFILQEFVQFVLILIFAQCLLF